MEKGLSTNLSKPLFLSPNILEFKDRSNMFIFITTALTCDGELNNIGNKNKVKIS